MSIEALALALVSTVRPTTAAAVWVMLGDSRPRRLLALYLLAGMAVSLTAGIAVILLAGGTLLPRLPSELRGVLLIALGTASLLGAVVVRLGWLRRFRPHEPATAAPVHRLSPAGAATAGVVTHLPGVFYLAGLGAIAGTGAAAAGMVIQVLIYNLVWFAPALVALGICVFGTIPAGERWAGAVSWGRRLGRQYQDPIMTVCFAALGLWLVVKGVADLG